MLGDVLYRVLRPKHWIRLQRSSKIFDEFVRDAIHRNDISLVGSHHAIVGGMPLWTANYPYSFGHSKEMDLMPSPRLVDALHVAIVVARIEASRSDSERQS